MPTPEELARVNIDKQLEAAGWIVQDFKALNLGAGQGVAKQECSSSINTPTARGLQSRFERIAQPQVIVFSRQ